MTERPAVSPLENNLPRFIYRPSHLKDNRFYLIDSKKFSARVRAVSRHRAWVRLRAKALNAWAGLLEGH